MVAYNIDFRPRPRLLPPSLRRPKQIQECGIRALPSWREQWTPSPRRASHHRTMFQRNSSSIQPQRFSGVRFQGSAAPKTIRCWKTPRWLPTPSHHCRSRSTSRSTQTDLLTRLWYIAGGYKRIQIQEGTAVPAGLVHTGIGFDFHHVGRWCGIIWCCPTWCRR